ncbi:MAG: 50S ribosomal protein L24 [Patescibacteria group bacterium]|nr:50S ribosomal protein L24 [Patescibacteria group bacterium]
MKIVKGDNVKILCGKDRGKTGKVLRAIPSEGKIVVEKVNVVKKHRKGRDQRQKSERISIPAPIRVSNVQLICSKCGKSTRIGSKEIEGKKVRACKKCGAEA